MTIVFSGILPRTLIVMTVDSAITLDFEDHSEYDTGRKAYSFPGVGCVATWGARDHNHIGRFLDSQKISPATHSIHDLIRLTEWYLTRDYRPQELQLGDVGYHVAGFDQNGDALLYHIFWGFDQPRPENQLEPKYEKYAHCPPSRRIELLYNGRNDLAHVVVHTLIDQVVKGKKTRFRFSTPVGLACFGDFVARFAAELTPEVGPPFYTFLISPHNKIKMIKNDLLSPISRDQVVEELIELGYPNPIR
jgi:hypothetical protein